MYSSAQLLYFFGMTTDLHSTLTAQIAYWQTVLEENLEVMDGRQGHMVKVGQTKERSIFRSKEAQNMQLESDTQKVREEIQAIEENIAFLHNYNEAMQAILLPVAQARLIHLRVHKPILPKG